MRELLESRPDPSLKTWRRRSLYTLENYREWSEWQPASRVHRDAAAAGEKFMSKPILLVAPDLRSPSAALAADEWSGYRRTLLVLIRQALVVGFSWKELLCRLAITFADPLRGYPRLENYFTSALSDSVLLEHPLLHADVLIYNLDVSYSAGSERYSQDSTTADWEASPELDRVGVDSHTFCRWCYPLPCRH